MRSRLLLVFVAVCSSWSVGGCFVDAAGLAPLDSTLLCSPACSNGGTCVDGVCDCSVTDYEGDLCEVLIDDCDGIACENGGFCVDGRRSYSCDCDGSGYEGDLCQTDIDECTEGTATCDPKGTATCVNSPGGFSCDCKPRYTGDDCDECEDGYIRHDGECDVDVCRRSYPCNSHGICNPAKNACDCDEGYTATRCDACEDGYRWSGGYCVQY